MNKSIECANCGHSGNQHDFNSLKCRADMCKCRSFTAKLVTGDKSYERADFTHRSELLEEAKKIITSGRNNTYGPPHQDFARSAGALTALYGHKLKEGESFSAHDIAIIVAIVKLSRLQWTPTHRDSWLDIAGYAACGWEAAKLTLGDDDG